MNLKLKLIQLQIIKLLVNFFGAMKWNNWDNESINCDWTNMENKTKNFQQEIITISRIKFLRNNQIFLEINIYLFMGTNR